MNIFKLALNVSLLALVVVPVALSAYQSRGNDRYQGHAGGQGWGNDAQNGNLVEGTFQEGVSAGNYVIPAPVNNINFTYPQQSQYVPQYESGRNIQYYPQ